jgi:YegS/Rv2252/BmrU family lipid kinase
MDATSQKVFVVYNPNSGKEHQADEVRTAVARHFVSPQWTSEIYETTGKEDVADICHAACERGASLVIAAGGDGTLIDVANGLVHSRVPLGILPMGTENFLARVLLIPMKLDEAVKLLVDDHVVLEVDALKVGKRHFFSNVSVGITPRIVNDTSSADKKLFGRLAYVLSMVKRSTLFQLQRFRVTLDGRSRWIRAAEVMISSTTLMEKPPFLLGTPETLSDGQLEVYVLTARTLGDYVRLAWDVFMRPGRPAAKLSHWAATRSARVEVIRRSRMVQADGEMIGRTPVEIQMVPKAVHVIMPRPAPAPAPAAS